MLASYNPTEAEREIIRNFVFEHDIVKVVLKELERICEMNELEVIKYDVAAGDDRKLYNLKLRAEGARKLCSDFTRHLESFRTASNKMHAAAKDGNNVFLLSGRRKS